jgi:hypothetical protein
MTSVSPFQHPYLRLVPREPLPRRIDVRISAADGRAPTGRSRAFRLSDHGLDELLAHAERLERRSS